ncbi:hypothetical protein A2852_01345 [Candidatus Adlerbacteria bacterium RIFCSPHIGHO2_01_FULL_54_23]|uniref:Nucleotide-diphospho-sugar transferase domain-containing protein n=3 Tax=Candidatus Adleribacteriota TaxID=1752736 RepID=A0A1F4Y062_9BACT|nr:MAG: hypothetical protein UY83_C0003G0016 [Candidatus Adlerbacteria bacterium GW2011_GWA1_54_10]KKW36386.1 MAG: hypothetical protein UY84_C0001G0277 [Candidatus Adlerbacteria bacterium GW2011_GWA2_54_12]KKW37462.1 MAG: hypothetical protein UY86_C0008G0019 [Candidatus Adlerbacteria bacterium GW2011_GWB1_54_7]OGC79255.1 MAG: hypothetical protein A2852_01345 [Candidatus Adlerbacteria bacterium RIFCSPHIGHO2_01_FULL_54_23]OGC87365.1 MAG: hypothetical protein A3B33_00235 [Candidatus Adlerbacteria 
MKSELTVLSVYHSAESKKFLELNYRLTKALNPGVNLSWLIADNTPDDFAGEKLDNARYRVVRHKSMAAFMPELDPAFHPARASYHHASALNILTPLIQTRWALILDADYYIVRKNWATDILAYMDGHNLGIFGSPWHPRWWKKIRYFPAIHSLFLDLDRVPASSLDFLPGHPSSERRRYFLKILPKRLRNNVAARLAIGSSRDTAYKLYERYSKNKKFYECTYPVFKPFEEFSTVSSLARYFFESFFPERFSYLPRSGTYSKLSFKDRGYFNAMGNGWEEFVWKDSPFGFHLRSLGDVRQLKADKSDLLYRALESFGI